MKNLIAVLTTLIFAFGSTAKLHSEIAMQANQVQASEIKAQIQRLPSGTIIEVRLNNKHKVIGTLTIRY